jgi:hypothetical protein
MSIHGRGNRERDLTIVLTSTELLWYKSRTL